MLVVVSRFSSTSCGTPRSELFIVKEQKKTVAYFQAPFRDSDFACVVYSVL